jgi:hypothetical protein
VSKKMLFEQVLAEQRLLHLLRQAAKAAPVVGHRAAAVRDQELQRRKVREESPLRHCMNAVVSAFR